MIITYPFPLRYPVVYVVEEVPVPAKLVERLTRTRVAQAFNIFLQSVDVGSRKLAELRLLIDNPEVVIRPDVSGIGLLDKVDVAEIVHRGERATDAVLLELKRAVAWPNRLRRRIFQHREDSFIRFLIII